MARTSKLIIGALLIAAVGVGLWGTLDYTTDTSMRSGANAADGSRQPDPDRLEREGFIGEGRRLRGTRQLLHQLRGVGFEEAIFLRGATPERLSVTFTGEQDVSVRTFYEVSGQVVSVGQTFGAPLPPAGGLIRLGPEQNAVEVDGVLYWSERGYILTVASESRELVERLRWRSL
jgi:hypothetical protein